jgi:isocitrate/isopropylmalate dehydrogenase
MLLSAALMLQHGLGRPEEAARLERAVETARRDTPTADADGTAGTAEFGVRVEALLREHAATPSTTSSANQRGR